LAQHGIRKDGSPGRVSRPVPHRRCFGGVHADEAQDPIEQLGGGGNHVVKQFDVKTLPAKERLIALELAKVSAAVHE
jgi:hypothetical protein